MKKELKKLLERLFVGAVSMTTIISTLSVNPTYAATTDNFQIITQNQQSIYRMATEGYMDRPSTKNDQGVVIDQGGFYTVSKGNYNTYIRASVIEGFCDLNAAVRTKSDAYVLMDNSHWYAGFDPVSHMDEPAKALRYYLGGGQDELEQDDLYIKEKGAIDRGKQQFRNEIDQEITEEQNKLYSRYTSKTSKHPINIDEKKYNVKDFGVNKTKAFESRLYFIDMDNLLTQSSNASNNYKSNLNDLANYILKNKDRIPTNGSQVQIESLDKGVTVFNLDDYSDAWTLTFGDSLGDMLCKVSKNNGNPYYEVELNYCLQDMYRWPATRTFFGIQETDLNKLNLMGLSQDFRMFGSFVDKLLIYPPNEKCPHIQIMYQVDPNMGIYLPIDTRTNYKSNM